MIAGRRYADTDDRDEPGDRPADFSGGEVVRMPRRRLQVTSGKRMVPAPKWGPADERYLKLSAMVDLRRLGYKADEIAVILGWSDRWIRDRFKKVHEAKELAEAHGRV